MKKLIAPFFVMFFLTILLFLFIDYENKIKFKKSFTKIIEFITSKEKKYLNLQKKIDNKLLTSKFDKLEIKTIELKKRDFDKPLGYLEAIEEKIIYLGGNGDFLLIQGDSIKNEIKSNLKEYFNNEIKKDELFTPFLVNPVRDILYHDGFLYVVILDITINDDKINYFTSVLKGKFSSDFINFEYFFKPKNFIQEADDPIDHTHGGGRIVVDGDDNFFLAVPEYGQKKSAQDKNSIFGKTLQILSIEDYKIMSIGHRNPQGFYYDKEKDFFLETEHGPSGGDEINIIKQGKNYGWPIVSKGTDNEEITKYHNHKKQGYYPPLYTWQLWNPGISQIIKIHKDSKFNFKDLYIVASLSGGNIFYGNHLYIFDIEENKATLKDKIFIGDRVRDLVYDQFNDRIVLVVENQEAIAIINLQDKKL